MAGTTTSKQERPRQARKPRSPFFYGWVIVAVCFLAEATAFGAGSASLAVFLQPMSADLGWSRTTLTFALTVQQLGNILVAPETGRFIDQRGPRLVMMFGAIVAGAGFIGISQVQAPWQFYILYGIAGAMGLQELGNLVTGSTVSKWFIRMRGRALAFSGLGLNTGAVVFGPVIALLISEVGWRSAWAVLGIFVVSLMLPVAAIFMRRSPEDLGLRPDGDLASDDETSAATTDIRAERPRPRSEEPRFTVKQALMNKSTWLIVLSTSMVGLALGTLNLHQVAYFIDSGLSLERASFFFAMGHLFTLPGKIMWGFLSERTPVRFCMAGNDIARAVSILLLLMVATGEARLWGYALFTGLGQGVAFLNAKIWADYYGRAFVGSIRGILTPVQVVSGLGGPLLAAVIYDHTSSYTISFSICTVALIVATSAILLARPPRPSPSVAAA